AEFTVRVPIYRAGRGHRAKARERAALRRRLPKRQIVANDRAGNEISSLVDAQVIKRLAWWSEAIAAERGCHRIVARGRQSSETVIPRAAGAHRAVLRSAQRHGHAVLPRTGKSHLAGYLIRGGSRCEIGRLIRVQVIKCLARRSEGVAAE